VRADVSHTEVRFCL